MTDNQFLKDVVSRCSFDGLIPKVTVRYADGPYNSPFLVVTRETTDTDTGKHGEVTVCYDVHLLIRQRGARVPRTYETWAGIVVELVSGNLSHDVREFFRFDGRAMFDPHR